jgi:hypothetical protein
LDLIAGVGWGYGLKLAQRRWSTLEGAASSGLVLTALVLIQLGNSLPYYPYYFSYQNPLVEKSYFGGYGEGLEQAALYLNLKPDSKDASAYVYAGMGSFSFFYAGETDVLKKVYLTEPGYPSIISGMQNADFLVLYSVLQNRQPESVDFLHILRDVQPEKIISIGGQEYVSIYRTADIPQSVYEKMSR